MKLSNHFQFFFCLDLKIIISVFYIEWNILLFAFNRLARYFNAALTSLFSVSIELLRYNRLVSSAMWWSLQNVIAYITKEGVLKQKIEGCHNS